MILEAPARAEHDIPHSGIMVVSTKGHGSHMAYAWTVLRVVCQYSHHCTSTHAPALASRRASSEVSKHNHVRIFPGTHKQKIGSPYIKPSPLRRRESPWQFAHALFANVSWRSTMASQAALEAADEARRYDRESAPSPEPRRSAPLTARLRQTQRRTIRRRSRWMRLLICWQGTSESLPPPGHLNLT